MVQTIQEAKKDGASTETPKFVPNLSKYQSHKALLELSKHFKQGMAESSILFEMVKSYKVANAIHTVRPKPRVDEALWVLRREHPKCLEEMDALCRERKAGLPVS